MKADKKLLQQIDVVIAKVRVDKVGYIVNGLRHLADWSDERIAALQKERSECVARLSAASAHPLEECSSCDRWPAFA